MKNNFYAYIEFICFDSGTKPLCGASAYTCSIFKLRKGERGNIENALVDRTNWVANIFVIFFCGERDILVH